MLGGMTMKNNIAKGILAVLFLVVCFMTAQLQKVQAAQVVAISSAQDLLKMENDPSGSCYLTKDVTIRVKFLRQQRPAVI